SYSYRLGGPNVNLGGNGSVGNAYGNVCSYAYSGPLVGGVGYASAGEIIWQNISVTASNASVTYYYNIVLADGGHPATQQPYFNAWVLDQSSAIIGSSVYTQECTNGVPPAGYA